MRRVGHKEDVRSSKAAALAKKWGNVKSTRSLIDLFLEEQGIKDYELRVGNTEVLGGGVQFKGMGNASKKYTISFSAALTAAQFKAISTFGGLKAEVSVQKDKWKFTFDPGSF